jgi:hypothetical protein
VLLQPLRQTDDGLNVEGCPATKEQKHRDQPHRDHQHDHDHEQA